MALPTMRQATLTQRTQPGKNRATDLGPMIIVTAKST